MLLSADHRPLIRNASFSYLSGNHYSGVTDLTLANVTPFSADGFVLVGELGQESSEVCQVDSVSSPTVTLTAVTTRAHSDATRVTVIPYDTVSFYWTATAVFDTDNPVVEETPITPNLWFTSATDSTHTTGYGWYKFVNSNDASVSGVSSAIPYASYGRNTAKNALDAFFSLLNGNDRRLVTIDDAWEWLNEAYDEAKLALDSAQSEYDASDGTDTFSVTSAATEYSLPSNFSEMIDGSVTVDGDPIYPIDVSALASYLDNGSTDTVWYVRNGYFGVAPTPTSPYTVTYRFVQLPTRLNAYTDAIDLPKAGYNALKDFMLFRAKIKLKHDDAMTFLTLFEQKVARNAARSVNRDNSMDVIGVDSSCVL